MALSKVSVPTAVGGKTEMDLSCDHETSMNFLLGQPIYYRHLPRGEHFTDNTVGVVRPVSMAVPTFGRCRNNLRAFFVPYRLVFPQYDAGRADVLGFNFEHAAIPVDTPYVTMSTLKQYFLTVNTYEGELMENLGPVDPTTLTPPVQYDVFNSDDSNYYRFTAAGRRRYKLLRSLGYEVSFSASKDGFRFDCLALLCYAQIYLDWYSNSQYLDSSDVVNLRMLLSNNDPSSAFELNFSSLGRLLNLVFAVTYDTDEYFNAAWDNPIMPTTGQFSMPSVPDYNNGSRVALDNGGIPNILQQSNGVTSTGSQYIHDMLQALSNYQRRHALSGAREIDRALSDYGFVSDYASLKRAVYIGNRSFDIQFGDIYSTADTSDSDVSNLGNYAGRGFGQGQGTFDFTASEDGMLIIVSTIIPSCGMVQGYDRNNRHLNKFDFWDPNFEIGVQVLEKGEVYVSPNGAFTSDYADYAGKFGYTGRFGEYKRPRSWWTSEDRFPSVDVGGDSWNLFRLFSDDSFSGSLSNVVHSLNFTRAEDWETFNRIFNYVNGDRDKFKCFYHHEVHVQTPMKPLFETYDFKEDHKRIKQDINGSKLN